MVVGTQTDCGRSFCYSRIPRNLSFHYIFFHELIHFVILPSRKRFLPSIQFSYLLSDKVTNFLIIYVKSKKTLALFATLKIIKFDTKFAYIIWLLAWNLWISKIKSFPSNFHKIIFNLVVCFHKCRIQKKRKVTKVNKMSKLYQSLFHSQIQAWMSYIV